MHPPADDDAEEERPEETPIEREVRLEKEKRLRFLMSIFPFHYCVACHKCVSPIEQGTGRFCTKCDYGECDSSQRLSASATLSVLPIRLFCLGAVLSGCSLPVCLTPRLVACTSVCVSPAPH